MFASVVIDFALRERLKIDKLAFRDRLQARDALWPTSELGLHEHHPWMAVNSTLQIVGFMLKRDTTNSFNFYDQYICSVVQK